MNIHETRLKWAIDDAVRDDYRAKIGQIRRPRIARPDLAAQRLPFGGSEEVDMVLNVLVYDEAASDYDHDATVTCVACNGPGRRSDFAGISVGYLCAGCARSAANIADGVPF